MEYLSVLEEPQTARKPAAELAAFLQPHIGIEPDGFNDVGRMVDYLQEENLPHLAETLAEIHIRNGDALKNKKEARKLALVEDLVTATGRNREFFENGGAKMVVPMLRFYDHFLHGTFQDVNAARTLVEKFKKSGMALSPDMKWVKDSPHPMMLAED